jgi:integrase
MKTYPVIESKTSSILTEAECKNASCPPGKSKIRLVDSGGLLLELTPNGSKRWFWRYRQDDKVRDLSLGSYCKPGSKAVLMTLKQARAARDEARKRKDEDKVDPIQQRRADVAALMLGNATTYAAVAREFHGVKKDGWSDDHGTKWLRSSELHLFGHIGNMPLATITPPILLAVLRIVESKNLLSTAQDLLAMAGQVFRYGIQTGRCERNPAADLSGALKPHTPTHYAAILEPAEAGGMLRAIDLYHGQPTTKAAMQLAALFFQRPGNIRAMEWAWLDLDAAMLTIPAKDMKGTKAAKINGRPHSVPLATQAIAILNFLLPITGHGRYVFPSNRGGARPMSNNTINSALKRMDFGNDEHVAHGFRAMARTMIAENVPGIHQDVVEAELAHGKSGPLGSAYDRSEYMAQRKKMMQTWADYLDQLRGGANSRGLATRAQ